MHDTTEIEMQIRKRLIEAIQQSGLSNTTIAKRANIHVSMITDYKKNKMPSLVNFCVLCKVLDVSADEILDLKI